MLAQHLMIKDIITVNRNATIRDCIEILSKRHLISLAIVNEEQKVEGIFTDRDAIRAVAQNIPLDAPVEQVMNRNVHIVHEDTPLEEIQRILKLYNTRRLLVVDSDGRLVGLLSVRHILTYILTKLTGLL